MKQLLSIRRLAICLASACAALAGRADTVTVPVAADTFINSQPFYSTNNAGGHTWFDAGRDNAEGIRRGLIRFDLSTIPSGVTVTSAVVQFTVVKFSFLGAVASEFGLHRLTTAWNEGNKAGNNGLLATAGEANWYERMLGEASWTAPGALNDAVATASASALVNPVLGPVSWSGSGLVADIQRWLDNPATNFGWLVVSDSEATPKSVIAFASRESLSGAATLQVGYTPVSSANSAPVVNIVRPTNNATFTAPALVEIEVQATDTDGSVTNVQFFDGGTSLGSISSEPYRLSATLFPGTHVLTAVATDNLGATATSAGVTIAVESVIITNPIAARVPKGTITVELQTIADGMASPLGMAVPDDGSGRMFVHDQDGRVWIVTGNTRLPAPLLDVRGRLVQLSAYDERGLLGLAVHPSFSQNPLVYTYTSEPVNGNADFQTGVANNHQSVIAEWRISGSNSNAVDVTSRREVMRIDQPQSNHNGGAMQFGPDGFLYIALGDGGAANDVAAGHVPGGNAQDLNRIWGKLIRIDVDGRSSANGQYSIPATNPFIGTSALPEIYAYGFRNPFSFSFERGRTNLWLADVGQNKLEELNIVLPGGNYGWNLREGTFWFDPSNGSAVTSPVRPPPANLIDPVAQYDHDDGLAVIGGYVYSGGSIPALAGRYVLGDWGSFSAPSGRLFYLDENNAVNELRIGAEDRLLGLWLKGFGQGPDGELYAFTTRSLGPSGDTGRMLKLTGPHTQSAIAGLAPVNGTNLSLGWNGGAGPFALQRKTSLSHPVWQNALITNQASGTLPLNAASGFFRVADAARIPRIPLTAWATGAAEHPANNSTGSAFGIFALDGNTLTFNISYTGLSGTATGAHIHGPAPASGDASVLINLAPYNGGSWESSGTVSGVILLNDAQKALILAGQTYINFHTASFVGGEIRGQIAPVNMLAALSGDNESPRVNTQASGLGNLMLVGNRLTFNVTYQGLSGIATASHIHGPAAQGQNAGALTNLAAFNGGAYGTSGTLSGTLILSPTDLAALIDGRTYINIHTPSHSGGEIRGQILPQVTGVPLTALLSGLAERPPLDNSAFGSGSLSLEGNTLTFNVVYGGLSGPATAAHIHGPINTTTNAGVMVNLAPFTGGAFGTSGSLSGSVGLTVAQRDALLNGLTYINFHTTAKPGGELRGQIAPVLMTAAINGVNQSPSVATPGTGSGTFALVRDQLSLAVTYRGLLSAATDAHIHGPASLTRTAGVLLNLLPYNGGSYAESGSLSGTASLSVDALLNVIDGQTYINFHTTNNPGGEIRGHLMR